MDPHAVVSPLARLSEGVTVGAYAIVGDEVELGDGCNVMAHAVVQGPSRFGRENRIPSILFRWGSPAGFEVSRRAQRRS